MSLVWEGRGRQEEGQEGAGMQGEQKGDRLLMADRNAGSWVAAFHFSVMKHWIKATGERRGMYEVMLEATTTTVAGVMVAET